MFKDLFSNRLFIGALAIFIFCVGGSLLYMQHVPQQGDKELAETQTRVAEWNEKQKPTTAEVPEGDTSQGGHWHGDEWHADPHDPVEQQPTAEVSEPEPPPAYIYDPDADERPDGWDPELVFDTGHKKIDLNYRPLTEEEQAEYERLKATENPEHYGDKYEAGLRIVAIGNIHRKNTPAFLDSLDVYIAAGKSSEEIDAIVREFNGIFAD